MNYIGWLAAAALGTLLAALSMIADAGAQQIGTASSVKPDASGSVAGTLSAGKGVHAKEHIRTGDAGQAGLTFHDKTNLHVGPKSNVQLDRFVYDPNKGRSDVSIEVAKGALRFSTPTGTGASVKTPQGTLGIRG